MADERHTPEIRGFDADQRAEIIRKLTDLIGDRPCEMCGGPNWILNPSPVSPVILEVGNGPQRFEVNLGMAHPSVMVHCSTCGNSKMFSLSRMGFEVSGKAPK